MFKVKLGLRFKIKRKNKGKVKNLNQGLKLRVKNLILKV